MVHQGLSSFLLETIYVIFATFDCCCYFHLLQDYLSSPDLVHYSREHSLIYLVYNRLRIRASQQKSLASPHFRWACCPPQGPRRVGCSFCPRASFLLKVCSLMLFTVALRTAQAVSRRASCFRQGTYARSFSAFLVPAPAIFLVLFHRVACALLGTSLDMVSGFDLFCECFPMAD